MYRLLIVTTNRDVKEMFASMEGWEALDVKPPRVRESVEDAVECMKKHPIDAIAVEELPEFEPLMKYLDEQAPSMPLFDIKRDAKAQMATVREAVRLLTRLRADDSNDEYDPAYMMERERARWLRRVIAGLEPTAEDICRGLRLHRCTERPCVPCVLARLELPSDDGFMSERWHYGGERLEVALSNFFGREHGHMRLRVAVISPEEVRVLCYPVDESEGLSENAAFEYVQETIEQIARYLGLTLKVLEVRRMAGLTDFAAKEDAP